MNALNFSFLTFANYQNLYQNQDFLDLKIYLIQTKIIRVNLCEFHFVALDLWSSGVDKKIVDKTKKR